MLDFNKYRDMIIYLEFKRFVTFYLYVSMCVIHIYYTYIKNITRF